MTKEQQKKFNDIFNFDIGVGVGVGTNAGSEGRSFAPPLGALDVYNPAPNPYVSSSIRSHARDTRREYDDLVSRTPDIYKTTKGMTDEQMASLPWTAYWNERLHSMQDPRDNTNHMTPGMTRRYSRLADAINNRYYRMPISNIGSVTQGTTLGGMQESRRDSPEYKRMPIETEEQRQMELMRGWGDAIRRLDIARQGKYRDRDLERDNAYWQAELERITGWSKEELRRLGEVFNVNMSRETQRFIQYLTQLEIPTRQIRIASIAYSQNIALGNMVAGMFGMLAGFPTALDVISGGIYSEILMADVPDDEKFAMMRNVVNHIIQLETSGQIEAAMAAISALKGKGEEGHTIIKMLIGEGSALFGLLNDKDIDTSASN